MHSLFSCFRSFQSPFESSRGIPGFFVFFERILICNGRIILLMVHPRIHQRARLLRMLYRCNSSHCSQSYWQRLTSDLVQFTCKSFSSRVDDRHLTAWNENTGMPHWYVPVKKRAENRTISDLFVGDFLTGRNVLGDYGSTSRFWMAKRVSSALFRRLSFWSNRER